MPAKIMSAAVTMPSDRRSQSSYLRKKLITTEGFEIFVHHCLPSFPTSITPEAGWRE